jgi:hypothetical protein
VGIGWISGVEISVTWMATAILNDRTVGRGGPMTTTSMDITWFVGTLLEQDDVDALREGPRARLGRDGD